MAEEKKKESIESSFKQMVDNASENKSDFMISNGSYTHAEILFVRIIKDAEKVVSLLTERCLSKFYGLESVSNAFLNFIKEKSGKIRIIFESIVSDEEIRNNAMVTQLYEECRKINHPENLEIYKLKDDSQITHNNAKLHILLADKEGPFRFETHPNKPVEDGVTDAIANFGNPQKSIGLSNFLEQQISDNSEKISLP